jgi:hypothetical protein
VALSAAVSEIRWPDGKATEGGLECVDAQLPGGRRSEWKGSVRLVRGSNFRGASRQRGFWRDTDIRRLTSGRRAWSTKPSFSFEESFRGFVVSHSHTTITRHPSALSFLTDRRSRLRFAASFGSQNSLRECGGLPRRQSCPCQKQPWTSTTVMYRRRTMSGEPGNERWLTRKRRPCRWRMDRTISSAAVSRDRTAAMTRRRWSAVSLSMSPTTLAPK